MKHTTTPARLPLLALAIGPILIVIGHALSASLEDTGMAFATGFAHNRSEHVAGLLLTTIGAMLLVPGATGVLRVLDGRSMLARVGCTLGGIGAAALGVGDGMITLVAGALTRNDLGLAAKVSVAMDKSALAGLPFQFALLFVLGFVLLGIALVRLGGTLRWPGATLILGSVLVLASPSSGLRAAVTLTPLAIGFAAIAWALWRRPEPQPVAGRATQPVVETA